MATDSTLYCDKLKSPLIQLIAVYENVSKKRILCEEICQDCKSLLKPWPKRVNHLQNKAISPIQHSEQELTTKNAEAVILSSTDLEDLKLVNKVLAKAEKVRQSKVEINSPGVSQAVCEKTAASQQFAKPKVNNLVVQKSLESCLPAKNQTNGKLVAAPRGKTGIIKQSELKGILEHQGSKALPYKKSTITSHGGKQFAPHLRPAHQTAPFKTDTLPARRSKAASDTKLALSRSRSSSGQLDSLSQQQLISSKTVTLAIGKTPAVDCASSSTVSLIAHESGLELHHEDDVQLQTGRLRNLQVSSDVGTQLQTSPLSRGEELFSLEKQGAELKVSKEFSKLVSINCSLREELSAWCSQEFKLRPSEISAKDFYSKLNDDILSQRSKLSERLVVLNSFCRLYDWLGSLLDSVEHITVLELSEWRRVMRSKVCLEFVLREFVEMEKDFRVLIQTEQQWIKDCFVVDDHKTFNSRRSTPSQWLTNDLRVGRGFPRLSHFIRYGSHSQLAEYTSLLHRTQLQLLQRNILIEAGDDVIRLLEQTDSNDRSFKRLYQAAFSLLASNGEHFPVIIRDSF